MAYHTSIFCDGKYEVLKIPQKVFFPRSSPRSFSTGNPEKMNNIYATKSILNHVVSLDRAHQSLKLYLRGNPLGVTFRTL